MLGEVEIRAVLHAEHHVLPLHAAQRALAVRGQDVLHAQSRLGRVVEEAVPALDQGASALGGAGERVHGGLGLKGSAGDQAPGEAGVAQRRAAEFEGGPAVAVEAVGGLHRRGDAGVGDAQPLAPVGAQGAHEDQLARAPGGVGGGEAPAAGGAPDRGPVGGLEAGAVVGDGIDEGLQQQGREAVALAEVVRQAAQAQREHLGSEVATVDFANQEAGQAEDAVELLAAGGRVPADPLVAVGEGEGGGGKADRADEALVAADEIAQLAAGMAHRSAGMLVGEQLAVDLAVLGGVDELHAQAADLADLLGERGRPGDLLPEQAGPAVAAGSERRRELDQVPGVQHAQGLEAGGALGSASRRAEAELATDEVGQRRAMRR